MIIPASPKDLGLNPKLYPSWRPYQLDAVIDTLKGLETTDLVALDMPVGTGKTLVALALARMFYEEHKSEESRKIVILTGTKGLQDQYIRDSEGCAFKPFDIRGAGNYNCLALNKKEFPVQIVRKFHTTPYSAKCDHGPCLVKIECARKETGCTYFGDAGVLKKAKASEFVLTNYSMWMTKILGNARLLICDEGHLLEQEVDKAAKIYHPNMPFTSIKAAQEWAAKRLMVLATKELTISTRNEARVCDRLLKIQDETNWRYIKEETGGGWAPITFSNEGDALANSADKIVVMSGTIGRKDISRFRQSIQSRQISWSFKSFPSQFNKDNRRLLCYPLKYGGKNLGVTYKLTPAQEQMLLEHQVRIVKRVLPSGKGIIHTVSYDRARKIKAALVASSIQKPIYFPENARQINSVLQEYRLSNNGGILISPSLTTGFDFAGSLCRWQLIVKMPFANTMNPIIKARCEMDPNYSTNYAIRQLDQMIGRGVRSKEDWCETWISDGNASWALFGQDEDGNYLAPERLRESFVMVDDEKFMNMKVRME